MTEVWREVAGWPHYRVSNLGRVRSFAGRAPRILAGGHDQYGYKMFVLCNEGKRWTITCHRLVATAFIPNPENKATVNHINGVCTDNRVENLEWATYSENTTHGFRVLGRKVVNKGKRGPHGLTRRSQGCACAVCRAAVVEYQRAWREKNRERVNKLARERFARWTAIGSNREKHNARARRDRERERQEAAA